VTAAHESSGSYPAEEDLQRNGIASLRPRLNTRVPHLQAGGSWSAAPRRTPSTSQRHLLRHAIQSCHFKLAARSHAPWLLRFLFLLRGARHSRPARKALELGETRQHAFLLLVSQLVRGAMGIEYPPARDPSEPSDVKYKRLRPHSAQRTSGAGAHIRQPGLRSGTISLPPTALRA